ncbi:cytochrome P450 [Russula ochroleuca]|uniref:Cytochrome P450 n=1 Tax=Russula ochroleuca TaxID=152965 RepID=A0A9P5JXD6_9AGAM|nr:cytochrome P450 [Russula ochroleuca]
MHDEFTLKVPLLGGLLVVVSLFVNRYFRSDPMLDAIPTVGFSDPILSYFSTLRFFFDGVRMLKEGYQKSRPGLFKMALFRRWVVLAARSELIEDVRKAPEDVLSLNELTDELLQPEYTLDFLNQNDLFHNDVIRSKLTRNIAVTFKEVRDELVMAMDDFIPMSGDEWVKVPILETIRRVICRTTNRIFVGVPLCRDYDYQTLNLTFAVNLLKFGMIISLFPKPLRPIVSRILSNLPSQIQQEIEFIRPMVEERFAKMEEYGDDWDDKPNDVLMWLMSEAKGVERSVEGLARRLLLVNFAAVHSASLTLTQVLYRLLANPEYIEPLREEVDAVITEEGWTKAGIDKMHKIDSFLRESLRLDGFLLLAAPRLALRPFTFSNGMTVPAGTIVSIPASAIHTDERIYPNPDEFDGFRFAKLCESEGDTTASRYQSVSPSSEHLVFGLGRHVCPGRFLAVNEIKALFAHIIATYDIKFEGGKGVPREFCIRGMRIPGKANVMFRTRQK